MGAGIYVVGMASVYAGAGNLREFWETLLTRRCGFREFPERRLSVQEYVSENRAERDFTYAARAALVDGFAFDWKAHRVPKAAYEATDPVHWLALTTAMAAITDGGIDLDAVGRERIGVILGNSLTGEVSRANMLRLRWPYVRRVILDAAARAGLADAQVAALIDAAEQGFKDPFPVPNEDTLAGALANVIAGRICNVLDLNGGGYVVDGACASSLLAVSSACEALTSGRLDMVVTGGVDISLDPLELVGFARTGALATGPMRVYDKDAAGFIPGEGCGMLVLMRGPEVERHGLAPWARLAGWGISSDGSGGITAPKASGQALAMRRCYERSGFGAETLDFIEGHGTGTPVGDRQELLGFLDVTGGADPGDLRRTGVTSVKTLLGHTKAAAGAAGLIKAILAVNQRVLPPLAGFKTPADAFAAPQARLYPISRGACLPPRSGLRAGVSGAGFGGINCHVAVTGEDIPKRRLETRDAALLLASAQSAELFVASAADVPGLVARLEELLRLSAGMAEGELVDLAVGCALDDQAGTVRAAVVAETVEELRGRLRSLTLILQGAGDALPLAPPGTLCGRANPRLRIGYLIPGQGSQFLRMGGVLAQRAGWAATRRARWDARFAALGPAGLSGFIDRPVEQARTPAVTARWETALRDTRVAQPAIVMTSLQWIQWLRQVGLTPSAVAGHSLGEITALVAAHLLSETEAIDIVEVRAQACAAADVAPGGMLALTCGIATAQAMIAAAAGYAVVANDNAPDQVVVAGDPQALAALAGLARARGIGAATLNVSKAFHSGHMAAAAAALERLAKPRGEEREAQIPFFSGVQGGLAPERFDPFAYVAGQITAPVRFRETVAALAAACDILVEVGPGSVLTGLARRTLGQTLPIGALEPGPGDTDSHFCTAIGQLFVAGAHLDWGAFYAHRYWRPFVPARDRTFIESPCARADGVRDPVPGAAGERRSRPAAADPDPRPNPELDAGLPAGAAIEHLMRELVAGETGYDLEMISPDARLARDLNLDSIKIAEVGAELRARGVVLPDDLALGTTPIRELARAAAQQPVRESAGGGPSAAGPGSAASGALPADLPVLGYVPAWRDTERLQAPVPGGPVVILHAPERAAEAGRLVHQLAAAGVTARLDDGAPVDVPGDQPTRLIALPGDRAAAERVTEFFARLGRHLVARPGAATRSIVLIGGPGQAPVFGFAQSVSLEQPLLPILAVAADPAAELAPLALARITPGVRLLRVDACNAVQELRLERWEPTAVPGIPLVRGDIVVISGGAKGITAACAFALLQATGARGLLLGTSPAQAPGAEVEDTLQRMAAAGLTAVYLQCDVTDAAAVRAALQQGTDQLGTHDIVGLVHGAGVNTPTLATGLDPAVLRREYLVKVGGLTNLLAAIGPERLQLAVALGSVIGAVGMAGNSGYALANEALAETLAELKHAHPQLQVACPAYSVWSDVGMGAKLNVLASLERQQVAAIPPAAGIRWFLECCGQPAVPIPLVVAAPLHGLPTWRQARGTAAASGWPYVDDRVVHEPGVILVSRPALNPQRDRWLTDHAFRGALLFPTVQALTAIGNGARLLAGAGVVTRFLDLRITRPIVAAQRGDTTIELDVRGSPAPDWSGCVGAPGTARLAPAFAARVQLGTPDPGTAVPAAPDDSRWRVVPPEVGAHLYDWLLFQGPVFRRIERVLGLDLADDVHRRGCFTLRREGSAPGTPVPDPYFLDALLQSVQVLVPRDLCLPVGIAETVFYAAAWEGGATRVEAEITERIPTGYVTRVRAWNAADGAPVARYEGYRLNIVERYASRPDAAALFDPLAGDQAALAAWMVGRRDLAELNIALGAVADADQEARRRAAAVQVAAQLGSVPVATPVLTWRADGAPALVDRPGQGVSIAHDAARLLSACGSGRVGCDLQRIGQVVRPWGELLPEPRHRLWRDLTGALNDRDRAGAMVWAIHEALLKAGAAADSVTFVGMQDGGPRFRLAGGLVAAGVLELVLAGPAAIALVQLTPAAATRRVTHYTRDIVMTFKEALPPLRSPTASVFFAWMGELREAAMSDIRIPLAHAFSVGGKGMVTNGTRVRILRPVRYHAPLRAWVWLDRVLERQPATFELGFQWAETGPGGAPQRIVAQGSQRLTWVDVGPGGQVRAEPFPDFFADFINERRPASGTDPFSPPLGHLLEPPDDMAILWRRDPRIEAEQGRARLWLETDEAHANFVGNIYFSHTATLVERACQKALRHLGTCPCASTLRCLGAANCKNALRNMGACPGGFFATAFQLDHLGEAMPGDTLEAEVRLAEVGATFCTFDLALTNQSHGAAKIAAGRARFQMYATTVEEAQPQPMPTWLMSTLAKETSCIATETPPIAADIP